MGFFKKLFKRKKDAEDFDEVLTSDGGKLRLQTLESSLRENLSILMDAKGEQLKEILEQFKYFEKMGLLTKEGLKLLELKKQELFEEEKTGRIKTTGRFKEQVLCSECGTLNIYYKPRLEDLSNDLEIASQIGKEIMDSLKTGTHKLYTCKCGNTVKLTTRDIVPLSKFKNEGTRTKLKTIRGVYFSKRGARALEARKYEEAVGFYDKALKNYPIDTSYLNNKGAALLKLGRYKEALECFNAIIERYSMFEKDEIYFKGDTEEILKENNISAINNIGTVYDQLREYDNALKYHSLAIKLDPKRFSAYLAMALTLTHLNKGEEALDCLAEGIKIQYNLDKYPQLGYVSSEVGSIAGYLSYIFHKICSLFGVQETSSFSLFLKYLLLKKLDESEEAEKQLKKFETQINYEGKLSPEKILSYKGNIYGELGILDKEWSEPLKVDE